MANQPKRNKVLFLMDTEQQKAAGFVKRLLANPALQNDQILQKEDQILKFLNLNSNNLLPTLSSQSFFPGKTWQQIYGILAGALINIINETLFAEITEILSKIDFTFVSLLRQTNYPLSKCRDQMFDALKKVLSKYEARLAFIGPFTAVKTGMIDRYIEKIFKRNEYIHFELIKVQRLKMGKEEIKNFIKSSVLLKNAIYLITSSGTDESIGAGPNTIQKTFAEKAAHFLQDQLKLLPPEIIISSVNSNLSFIENKNMETTSRLTSIISTRCKNYKRLVKIDRGAENPDKSWLSIARRNFKFYGYDIKMIDELYRIAAENGW